VQEVQILHSRMFIWPGIHTEAGENVRVLSPETLRVFVLTDRPCIPIARHVAMSLQQARFDVSGGAAPASKSLPKPPAMAQLKSRLDALGPTGVAVVAVGGTATLHTGVRLAGERPLFLVPTTLRSQIDASVGGSSCAQLTVPWRPPRAVFSDPTLLRDLPLREFMAGLAEAVKCAMVQDPDLFGFMESSAGKIRDRNPAILEELIHRGATVKAAAIASPSPGPSARATLRYGQLVGGAIERLAGAAILHGEALAVGMEAEAFLAHSLGWASGEVIQSQNRLLKAMGLPTRAKGLPADRLAQPILARGIPRPDLPDSIGHARGPADVKPELLKKAIAGITK
jgi:3-dehydroquinate synthetase